MSTFNELIDFTRSTTGTYLDSVVYGDELVTNGTFDTDSDWSKGATWSFSEGRATHATGNSGSIKQTVTTVANKKYVLTCEVVSTSAILLIGISSIGQSFTSATGSGVFSFTFTAPDTTSQVEIYQSSGATCIIDNVSVKEVIGGQVSGTPLLRTAAINEPRLEYDASGNPLGLLIEEARTNLFTSTNFGDSVWDKRGFAVNSTTAEGPYGTTAIQITENNTNSNPGLVYLSDATDGTPRTFGVWLKASQNISIALATTGSLKTSTITVTPEWQFFWCTASNNSNSGPHIGGFTTITRGSGITLWAAMPQMEAGSFPTSYIPTSGSAVTRAADVASLPVERFAYNDTKGSVVVTFSNFEQTTASGSRGIVGTSLTGRFAYINGGKVKSYDGTSVITSSPIVYKNTFIKSASTFDASGQSISVNGTAAVTGSFDNTWGNDGVLYVGRITSSLLMSGHITSLQYYPKRLSNEKLELLTQPSASPTMNLTFDGQATSTLVEGLHD